MKLWMSKIEQNENGIDVESRVDKSVNWYKKIKLKLVQKP